MRRRCRFRTGFLRVGDKYSYQGRFFPGAPVEGWSAELVYSDFAGVARYRALFDSVDRELGYEEILPPLTRPGGFWNVMRERWER